MCFSEALKESVCACVHRRACVGGIHATVLQKVGVQVGLQQSLCCYKKSFKSMHGF